MQDTDKIEFIKFKEIDLNDSFFDSLREDYDGFDEWFKRKEDEKAFVSTREDGTIQDFLYLKPEEEELDDIEPPLPAKKRLKVGTFKINSRGTLRGERFMKKILDIAVSKEYEEIYVTMFPKQEGLINLFTKYGFNKVGTKGGEEVYLKEMNIIYDNSIVDYPRISTEGVDKWVLGIYPKFHTRMFPDSRLLTERNAVIKDLSPTNSIYKCYVTKMKDINLVKPGDIIVIYRTKDEGRPNANYSSVCTSICVVLDNQPATSYGSLEEYIKHVSRYNIFSKEELTRYYKSGTYVLTMTYNAALAKRVVKNTMLNFINEPDYWGFFKLSDVEFDQLCEEGNLDENYIIDKT